MRDNHITNLKPYVVKMSHQITTRHCVGSNISTNNRDKVILEICSDNVESPESEIVLEYSYSGTSKYIWKEAEWARAELHLTNLRRLLLYASKNDLILLKALCAYAYFNGAWYTTWSCRNTTLAPTKYAICQSLFGDEVDLINQKEIADIIGLVRKEYHKQQNNTKLIAIRRLKQFRHISPI